jgi:hypothetical protein
MTAADVYRFDESVAPGHSQETAQASERPELPEYLRPRVAADQPGRGVSEDTEDAIYPLITIFQPTSKGVNARSPDYIAGAALGKFFLRSLPNPVRDGEKGIDAIVWFCDSVFKEWLPNRTKVVGVHLQRPEDACLDPDTGRTRRRNGNELVKTRQIFLLHEGLPFELPLNGTSNDFFRELTAHFRSYTDEQGRCMPCYVRRYKFVTDPKSKPWFASNLLIWGGYLARNTTARGSCLSGSKRA